MRVVLTVPRSTWAAIRRELEQGRGRVLEVDAGARPEGRTVEYFVADARPASGRQHRGQPRVRFGIFPEFMSRTTWRFWGTFGRASAPGPVIEVGMIGDRGFCGAETGGPEVRPVDELRLPGAGMERWLPAEPPSALHAEAHTEGRFSRLEGALGGSTVLRNLQETDFCIVGIGRTGSLLAHDLARLGVRKIILVDADRVETHNLDAMDGVTEADLGLPKAETVARFLRRDFPGLDVEAHVRALEHPAALRAASSADFLITAPDSGRPRLVASLLAVRYCRPHLDLGTGVQRVDGRLEAGADVRLLLPPEACLLDFGGIRRLDARPRDQDWRTERAGSLRSINQAAAGIGLHLVERLYAGEISTSTWIRLTIDPRGISCLPLEPHPNPLSCAMCRQSGHGERQHPR